MVHTYSSAETLPEGVKTIGSVPAAFAVYFSFKAADEIDEAIMQAIDKAVIVDRRTGLVRTPFGLADRRKLSNGCKTALLTHWIKKNNRTDLAIDVVSCGYNALDEVYKLVDNTDICVIQRTIPTHRCKWEGELTYDGKYIGSPMDLMIFFLTPEDDEEEDWDDEEKDLNDDDAEVEDDS